MSDMTIAPDGNTRTALTSALLAMLGEETQKLDQALMQADREQHPQHAHDAFRHVSSIGAVLDAVGWQAEAGPSSVQLETGSQLPLALSALRQELEYLQEVADDASAHGNAGEIAQATARVQHTAEALRVLEEQGAGHT